MSQPLETNRWPALIERHQPPNRQSTKYSVMSMARTMLKEKSLQSGNGIIFNISLVEPVLFLQGFDQRPTSERSTVVLRGSLHLRVIRPAKIKAVTLRFHGKAVTKWPQGIPPNKIKFEETNTIINNTWPFFDAQSLTAATEIGADYTELVNSLTGGMATQGLSISSSNNSSKDIGSGKASRVSLQANSLLKLVKGKCSTNVPSVARKGYEIFPPGDYTYDFELPLESNLPETIDLKMGSVKYELKAIVERAGVFSTNLVASKEVTLIRTPAQCALEQVEPIVVSRTMGNRVKLNVTISGKSFPLGAQVPISINLTPLAKAQFQWVKVFVTEHIEYFCLNKQVHRIEPVQKIQLFEKRADAPPTSSVSGGLRRTVRGGVATSYQDEAVSEMNVQGLTDVSGSLSRDFIVGTKVMEFLVPLPSCHNMKHEGEGLKLHSDTTFQNILVHHWIKIIIRLSMVDRTDSNKRRLFEISVDSPIRILSHQVTEAINTLPTYSAPDSICSRCMNERDCSKAPEVCCATHVHLVSTSDTPNRHQEDSYATLSSSELADHSLLRQVHIGRPVESYLRRPTYLFRALSFDPPAFEDKGPPLSLEAPPPPYKQLAR
ncbi:hypothetical protein BKA66DRAFT_418234 [Pyrenochaeta sp. MPI-SDFR-AT-0127]|nr:hypothetical protein BKA66DRAFT_418234 [Pyrenochaeta sp. MPI-SDFR-AT-0127]